MRYAYLMRTTLEIQDDVLNSVKEIAVQQHSTAGAVISGLLRLALQPQPAKLRLRNGIPLLPLRPNGPKMNMEIVNRLRDEDE